MIKTILILDSCGQDALRFYVVEEDLRHWHNACLNSTDIDPKLEDEINAFFYGPDNEVEYEAPAYSEDFPLAAVTPETVVVTVIQIP
jgi:hypothetical protein